MSDFKLYGYIILAILAIVFYLSSVFVGDEFSKEYSKKNHWGASSFFGCLGWAIMLIILLLILVMKMFTR